MKNRFFTALVILLLPIGAGYAFWSKFATTYKVHQSITSDVLDFSGYTYQNVFVAFSDNAIDAINAAHAKVDSSTNDDGTKSYFAQEHFDSESFQDAFQLLSDRRAQLMEMLSDPAADQAEEWELLGYMLHAVQDFYSHSNWVQNGNTTPVGFGALIQQNSAFNISPAASAVCNGSGAALLASPEAVTSGYYQVSPLPAGKCQHGSLYYAAIVGCVGGVVGVNFTPDGINHDHPCFSNADDISFFLSAKDLASQETTLFVDGIVQELIDAGNTQGICTLLGLSDDEAPCNGTGGSTSATQTFIQYTIDSVPFGPFDPCSASEPQNVCGADNVGTAPDAYLSITYTNATANPSHFISLTVNNATPLTLSSNGASLPIATTTGPTLSYPLNTNEAMLATTPSPMTYAIGSVGFLTSAIVSNPPTGYPSDAMLFSASYLTRNPTAQPGTVTIQLQAIPITPAPVFDPNNPSIQPVANVYASGSFQFYVADPSDSGSFNIGSHEVQGSYLIDTGIQCSSTDGKTMSCGLGDNTF